MSKILRSGLLLLAASLTLAAADLTVGTWKLNAAKSKMEPGPLPKSVTSVITMDGDWVVNKTESVSPDGKATSSTNKYKMDGKEYPYKSFLGEGMLSIKKVDDHHAEGTIKLGKNSIAAKLVYTKDGKTRTLTGHGTDAAGKAVHYTMVYDRQ